MACKSITSVLKSNAYKDRYISYIVEDGQIKDIIPPGMHTAGRGLGIAMQYFQNACFARFLQSIVFVFVTVVYREVFKLSEKLKKTEKEFAEFRLDSDRDKADLKEELDKLSTSISRKDRDIKVCQELGSI